ncbi:MAG TPA: Gfo/Idh/MocA family oxidoreductase [Armatimonadota bacterium]|nr:Gfo/Idh/MocA family oxidoreductase [Armatimonadota bacterium]
MNRVRVGLVGCGFSAGLHIEGYKKLPPEQCAVAAVCGVPKEMAEEFAAKHGIPEAYSSMEELLEKANVDAVDLAVPNYLHAPFIIEAAKAGKHVFCEKPLTGYFGGPDTKEGEPIGKMVPKSTMLKHAKQEVNRVMAAIQSSGITFGYAENWLYAPAYVKLWQLAKTAGGTILRIEAEESHSGSHADYAKTWRGSGGGSLMVKGSHPLGAALQLKWWEGEEKFGKPIRAASVVCEVGNLTWIESFTKEERHYVRTGWKDVEDWGIIVVKFEDGSVAEVKAGDTTLGGVHNYLEAYLSNARLRANINPNDSCVAYAPEGTIFEPEYISEKIETKGGWTFPSPDEDWHQGYPQEIADFVAAIREGRQPVSGATLAREVTLVLYAAYVSAEEGRRVDLKPILEY